MGSGVVLTKHWGRPVPLLAFTGWQLTAGGAVLLPLVAGIEGWPSQITVVNIGGFLWLTTAGTVIAYMLWFRGIERLPVAQVTLIGLFSPVVAAAAGWAILGQALTPTQGVGISLVLLAIWLGQRSAYAPMRHRSILPTSGPSAARLPNFPVS